MQKSVRFYLFKFLSSSALKYKRYNFSGEEDLCRTLFLYTTSHQVKKFYEYIEIITKTQTTTQQRILLSPETLSLPPPPQYAPGA